MLDTIKVGILLTRTQHQRILQVVSSTERWQWVLHNSATGELLFRRFSGLAATDGASYHRELRWDVPHSYSSDCRLTLEFSIPKFWYGHNVHLLYDFIQPLRHLKKLLEEQLGLKTKAVLPDVMEWQVLRADFCYAWRFPSDRAAHYFLNSLKRLHFPRKKPIIRDTSIFFQGHTYSIKIYEKHSEFRAHDLKEMLKSKASIEWVNYCETLSKGVLRFEVTARARYLKRHQIKTVQDLTRPLTTVAFENDFQTEEEKIFALFACSSYYLDKKGTDLTTFLDNPSDISSLGNQTEIFDGMTWYTPPLSIDFNGCQHFYPGGNITFSQRDNVTAILQYLLEKFLGKLPGMETVDQIQEKLMQTYKPVKAARLVSFWLYVQRFGTQQAKDVFGHNSYYVSRRDLKKAGVGLIEPPTGNNVVVLDRDFLTRFRMQIPSEDVVNKVDDFRESGNLLNLPVNKLAQ